jgi:hypothetical protein
VGRRVDDGGGDCGSQPSQIVRRDPLERLKTPSDLCVKSVTVQCADDGFVTESDGRDAVQDRLGFVSIDVRHFGSLA